MLTFHQGFRGQRWHLLSSTICLIVVLQGYVYLLARFCDSPLVTHKDEREGENVWLIISKILRKVLGNTILKIMAMTKLTTIEKYEDWYCGLNFYIFPNERISEFLTRPSVWPQKYPNGCLRTIQVWEIFGLICVRSPTSLRHTRSIYKRKSQI